MSEVALPNVANVKFGKTLGERQAELRTHGFEMAAAVSRGLPTLHENGAVADATTTRDKIEGKVRYRTTQQSRDDYAGGWRLFVRENGKAGLIRLTICQPVDASRGPEGFVEAEIADPTEMGGTKLPTNERSVRVDIDGQGVPHVAGRRAAHKFSVDDPNPNTLYADFNAADSVFHDAAAGLSSLQGSISDSAPIQATAVTPGELSAQ